MPSFRSHFPIFLNNPGLIYLDSASSAQKPKQVLDFTYHFLANNYANIHRGSYELSEKSEELYHKSKEKVRDLIGAKSTAEITYTYNATYAVNMLTLSLARSNRLQKGDRVLLTQLEHHANIVPWLILKEDIGIEVDFVRIDADFRLDMEDFKRKYTSDTKVVAITAASNVTGTVNDLATIGKLLREDTLFVVDGSQAVMHYKIDVQKLNIDFLVFTGHKIGAENGIGVLYGKKELLKTLSPAFWWGGCIDWVKETEYKPSWLPNRFESGTPNISGAISLFAALDFLDEIGGYETMETYERELLTYTLEKIRNLPNSVRLIGPKNEKDRINVWSFTVEGEHVADVAERMAQKGICVRAWHHCAEPLMNAVKIPWCVRASYGIYTTKEDIDAFFNELTNIKQAL